MNNLPEGCFIVGKKLMMQCAACGKIVRVDKAIIGSMHICVDEQEQQQDIQRQGHKVKLPDLPKADYTTTNTFKALYRRICPS